jgi:hypothetical protein
MNVQLEPCVLDAKTKDFVEVSHFLATFICDLFDISHQKYLTRAVDSRLGHVPERNGPLQPRYSQVATWQHLNKPSAERL